MNEDTYKQAFEAAIDELSNLMARQEELDNEREELDGRIIKLREGVFGLSKLCGQSSLAVTSKHPDLFPDLIPADTGLTDAVRQVMKTYAGELTPVGVRTALKVMGYDLSKYKNVLPTLHTILKRLEDGDELITKAKDGKTWYKWKATAQKESRYGIERQRTGNASHELELALKRELEMGKNNMQKIAEELTLGRRKNASERLADKIKNES